MTERERIQKGGWLWWRRE